MKMHMHAGPHCQAPGVRNIEVGWCRREWPESARNGAAALWVGVIVGTVARIFST
jgi:hypothetical protein